jgi:glyoxylase-like metal-dependent hydrolase (beta-lactamase superfamily II)
LRAVSVHRDVVVVTSRMWQTTATAVRAPQTEAEPGVREAFLVDSPYFPDELELLPALLGQAGFEVDALLATHADFDHLLGRLAFPAATLGLAETSMVRVRSEPGGAQRALRDADAEHYVVRPAPLSLGGTQSIPVPGRVELGGEEIELHPAEGHTADGMALGVGFAGVVLCGDYLSGVEIPVISPGGSLADYRATLARLRPLVESADVVVPGHGAPARRGRALELLEQDAEYLDAVERGEGRPRLPPERDTARQRRIHEENLRACR